MLKNLRHTYIVLGLAILFIIPKAGRADVTVEEVKQAVLKELGDRPRTVADSPIFNPAMGLVLDAVAGDTKTGKGNFEFRSAELNFQSIVDPFGKMYAVINGTSDGLEVEEAAVVTNPLPGRINLRVGRFFANFGRLPKFHDHELPFVNRTTSLDTFINGESRMDGIELSHLFSTPFYLQGTLGASNKLGAENTRLEAASGQPGDSNGRRWNAFTYNARLVTYIPVADNHGIDLGVSEAYTPRQNYVNGTFVSNTDVNSADPYFSNNRRYLTGIDATYRYEPLEQNNYRKILWGTEVFNNQERREVSPAIFERQQAWGGYSYVDARLWKTVSVGGFYDYAENLDNNRDITRTRGAILNYILSEFQKVRLQYSQITNNQPGISTNNQVFVQYSAIIGKHTHAFKDR